LRGVPTLVITKGATLKYEKKVKASALYNWLLREANMKYK